jgi:sugar lactone lactonase YvrE
VSPTPQAASLNQITWIGEALVRPECVLTTKNGSLFTADWRSGVAHTKPNGQSALYAAAPVDGEVIKPNGIALCSDGSFLLAHLGDARGGVYRLRRNGETTPVLQQVEGVDLPPTNFPLLDASGRLYVTVSTRLQPRALGYRKSCNDGFIVVQDRRGVRIVADGLGYTNEIAFDADGRWLYVNETFTRRLSRFPVLANGDLGAKQVVAEFGAGVFPDGMALDVEGNVWVVSIVSNRLIRVSPDGTQRVWLEDCEPEHVDWVEAAYRADTMGRPHLDGVKGKQLRNISSIAFGGIDIKTGFLGCLLGDRIASIPMPAAGLPPVHWSYQ